MTKSLTQQAALFVCGCPRSGTSAIAAWLSRAEGIVIGMERYQNYWNKHLAFPDHALTVSRFFDVQQGDTWYESLDQFPEYYRKLREKWDSASFLGDKVPALWRNLDGVFQQFPDAHLVYL